MPGRVESYIHSDSITANKGGSIVRITSQTDFAAKTDQFIEFCERVAMLACGVKAENWEEVILVFPGMEETRKALIQELGENIEVTDIINLFLDGGKKTLVGPGQLAFGAKWAAEKIHTEIQGMIAEDILSRWIEEAVLFAPSRMKADENK